MALVRPVTKTIISTTTFGHPVADFVTANTPTAWTALTLQSGWVNTGGNYQTAQYRKIGDVGYLRGRIKSGAIGQVAFTLPAGFRPPAWLTVNAMSLVGAAWSSGISELRSDGTYIPVTGSATEVVIDYVFSVTA